MAHWPEDLVPIRFEPTTEHLILLTSLMISVRNDVRMLPVAAAAMGNACHPDVEAVTLDLKDELFERIHFTEEQKKRVADVAVILFHYNKYVVAATMQFHFEGPSLGIGMADLIGDTVVDLVKKHGFHVEDEMLIDRLSSNKQEQETLNRRKKGVDEDVVAKFRAEMDSLLGNTEEGGEHRGTHGGGTGDSSTGS